MKWKMEATFKLRVKLCSRLLFELCVKDEDLWHEICLEKPNKRSVVKHVGL